MTETDPRWIVTVIYRGDQGELDNQFPIEELDELQSIIEQGPDWNALDKIEIRLNPRRQNYDVALEGVEAAFEAFNPPALKTKLRQPYRRPSTVVVSRRS
jgi:hypothetical protein